jgi:carboxyl-terminal processing protease
MDSHARTVTKAVAAVFFLCVAFFAGYGLRAVEQGDEQNIRDEFSSLLGEQTSHEDINLRAFWDVWDAINDKYVTSEMPSDTEKMYGAMGGLVDSLEDPYSIFLPPIESKMFEEDVQGNFSGVGMEVGIRDELITVIAPLKDTPAERAGILSGDVIIAISGTSTFDLNLNEAVSMIRGEQGSTVTLNIVREGEDDILEIDVVRDTINIPVIDSYLRDDGIYLIELYSFSATSPDLFRQALRTFIESGSSKLILDLRGNPGGYFEVAVDMASWFLPTGKVVARESYGGNAEEKIYRSKGYDIFSDSLELAILLDGGSASASEILAGALREHGVAALVGKQSFGKGSVQELIKITDDTSLKLTIARWLTPEGISISEEGLTPDIETDITIDEFRAGLDPQLDTAVEYLLADDKETYISNSQEPQTDESNS